MIYPRMYLYQRLVQAKLYIDVHYSKNINAGNIASEASFSRFHFIRLFRKTYGMTPHQYLTHVRIAKAKELLQTKTSVTEVCTSVGFESMSSFSGLFKKAVRVPPSVFQELHHKRQKEINKAPAKYIPGCFAAAFLTPA